MLGYAPFCLGAPLVNFVVMGVVGYMSHWSDAILILVFSIVMFATMGISGKYMRDFKIVESELNDTRVKLVSDMVTGIRTIKTHGWEKNYFRKIENARAKQVRLVWLAGLVFSMGLAVFQNFGFLVYLAIALNAYWRG
jgi:ABC-type bacteriocin/lantibiotic exporter with double-glycine peptidase domain